MGIYSNNEYMRRLRAIKLDSSVELRVFRYDVYRWFCDQGFSTAYSLGKSNEAVDSYVL
jgi:hypothetical protein